MESQEIRITISAPTGAGKTTLALLLADTLASHGIDVDVNDYDVRNCLFSREDQPKRIKVLSGSRKVIIDTVQTPPTRAK